MRIARILLLFLTLSSTVAPASNQCSRLLTDMNISKRTVWNYKFPIEQMALIEIEGTNFDLVRAKVKYARENRSAEEVWLIINKQFNKVVFTIEIPKAQQSVHLERIGSYSIVMGTFIDFYGESKITVFDPYNFNTLVIPNTESAIQRLQNHYL